MNQTQAAACTTISSAASTTAARSLPETCSPSASTQTRVAPTFRSARGAAPTRQKRTMNTKCHRSPQGYP